MDRIEIVLNGRKATVVAGTLADVVAAEDLKGVKVATALNGNFVPEALRANTALSAGDRIEIVSPRQGG